MYVFEVRGRSGTRPFSAPTFVRLPVAGFNAAAGLVATQGSVVANIAAAGLAEGNNRITLEITAPAAGAAFNTTFAAANFTIAQGTATIVPTAGTVTGNTIVLTIPALSAAQAGAATVVTALPAAFAGTEFATAMTATASTN